MLFDQLDINTCTLTVVQYSEQGSIRSLKTTSLSTQSILGTDLELVERQMP